MRLGVSSLRRLSPWCGASHVIKARPWNGKDLKGTWEVTLKIDGVRALLGADKVWRSRSHKLLYNLPQWKPGMPTDVEVYVGGFRDTIRATRTQKIKEDTPRILPEHLYSLDPLDVRLRPGHLIGLPGEGVTCEGPSATAEKINTMLAIAVKEGYEGLVLRQGDKWLKVKPEETHDVLVTGAFEGKGKHKGRLGGLVTAKGEVGTGFTDDERLNLWLWFVTGHNGIADCPLEGQTIEVSCMHFTPDGKFRHPRFIRFRPDKIAEE
jgi:hypothetical protein